jgi:hypothetical protein
MFFSKIEKNDFILPIINHVFCIFGVIFPELLPFDYDILLGSKKKLEIWKKHGNVFSRKKYKIFFTVMGITIIHFFRRRIPKKIPTIKKTISPYISRELFPIKLFFFLIFITINRKW